MKILEKKFNLYISSQNMFVMMADVHLKDGAEEDFKKWFSESNKVLANFPGFVSRRFLKANDGSYRIIVEHESKDTFIKMHNSPEHDKLHPEGHSYMNTPPERKTFSIIAE